MRIAVAVLSLALCGTANAQHFVERTFEHGAWKVQALRHAWNDSLFGAATGGAIPASPDIGFAGALILCSGGKPALALSWPRPLTNADAGIPFTVRIGTGRSTVEILRPFRRGAGPVIPPGAYLLAEQALAERAFGADRVAFAPGTSPVEAAVANVEGLRDAWVKMQALCAGRMPD